MPERTAADRFWAKVQVPGPNGCWTWLGSHTNAGYARIAVDRKMTVAHRFAYELLVGPIPAGLEIDHTCRNRGCVNPSHLEAVTHAENMRRGQAARPHVKPSQCPQGHAYDEENTYTYPDGRRACRACWRARKR